MTHHLTKLEERYIIHEVMGRGESGTVYRAFDRIARRDVALTAIPDSDAGADQLTQLLAVRSILISLSDPALVPSDDIGEFEENGKTKRYFTAPLLKGVSLERLIRDASARLSINFVLKMISQVCRALHQAHEQGLAHGKLRPSSIFVPDEKGIKILDFGLTGKPDFQAPEQREGNPPTPLSDQFSLAAVTYEALTGHSPFVTSDEPPPPVCYWNDKAGLALSQVIRRAMAKQPQRRFANLVEFNDGLRNASRNQPIRLADRARIRPRMQRAALCLESGDLTLTRQILNEVEFEGYLDDEILNLRKRLDQASRRLAQRSAIGSARRHFDLADYPSALEKAQQAIDLDPSDSEALALKNLIEKESRKHQIQDWLQEAREHLLNGSVKHAREVLDNVLAVEPENPDALQLAEEIDAHEKEAERTAAEKADLYEAAVRASEQGDIGVALDKMNLLEAMERDLPDSRRNVPYRVFYHWILSEHEAVNKAHDEASAHLAAGNWTAAMSACQEFLEKYPNHARFLELKGAVENRRREGLAPIIAEFEHNVEIEPDLERRVRILETAVALHSDEPHFAESLRRAKEKRDLVSSLIAKARTLEERSEFTAALDRWQIVGSLHARQPGLATEIGRLIKHRDKQARRGARADWIDRAQRYVDAGDDVRARQTVEAGLLELPGDQQLLELNRKLRIKMEQSVAVMNSQAESDVRQKQNFVAWCLKQARRLQAAGDLDGAIAIVAEGLGAVPGEPSLLAFNAGLQTAKAQYARVDDSAAGPGSRGLWQGMASRIKRSKT